MGNTNQGTTIQELSLNYIKHMRIQIGTTTLCAFMAVGLTQKASADLVSNGGFEATSNGAGELGVNTDVTGWSVGGTSYSFLFPAGTADTTGANGVFGNVQLWGPGNGVANGLPATSPNGGNFVGNDGDFQQGPIFQTINGLTPGQLYTLSFFWGAAQQQGFTGASTEQWQVSLGSQTQSTPVASIPSQGFSGWISQTFGFTPTSSSEVLSFLAQGTPDGVPTFAVLDGVSLNSSLKSTSAPDAASTCMLLGLAGSVVGYVARRRRQ